jgi:hypothetical protein
VCGLRRQEFGKKGVVRVDLFVCPGLLFSWDQGLIYTPPPEGLRSFKHGAIGHALDVSMLIASDIRAASIEALDVGPFEVRVSLDSVVGVT